MISRGISTGHTGQPSCTAMHVHNHSVSSPWNISIWSQNFGAYRAWLSFCVGATTNLGQRMVHQDAEDLPSDACQLVHQLRLHLLLQSLHYVASSATFCLVFPPSKTHYILHMIESALAKNNGQPAEEYLQAWPQQEWCLLMTLDFWDLHEYLIGFVKSIGGLKNF